jgi:UDP-glucose 4-epimerase
VGEYVQIISELMAKTILVTGGAGYIGSHTVIELMTAGYSVVILDNLCNSHLESVRRVERLVGQSIPFIKADVRDEAGVRLALSRHPIDAVIHFAALKAVGESVAKPLAYYENNVGGTTTLLKVLNDEGIKRFVFSSSATVYGDPASVPIREDFPTGPTNPYGYTKWMTEFVLKDMAHADPAWAVGILRYFNPVGAHLSGTIGEDPQGLPNNLMPFVAQVAVGRRKELSVFGGDWPTKDGTGVRDYIHVVDLAQGHVKAVDRVFAERGCYTVNLGTGQGYSVLEMVKAFERASGRSVPFQIVERRPGDIGVCYADPSQAQALLGWTASRGINEMCEDTWRWQRTNPQGFVV